MGRPKQVDPDVAVDRAMDVYALAADDLLMAREA
jgi:hypothetical protein